MPSAKSSPSVSDYVSSSDRRAVIKASPKKIAWFSLAELIVVITILAILATIGFLALSGYSQDAKDSSVKANVRSVITVIASESSITGNSPRYYVVHDAGAALVDGMLAYVAGNPVVLTGGQYGTTNANYSAGNPDWTKLRLNPDKFRLSSLDSRLVSAFDISKAAYDPKAVSVGAVDVILASGVNGRARSVSYYQAAGTAPSGNVTVLGTFPAPTGGQAASGAVVGLVKAPTGTGALVDGASVGSASSGGGGCVPSTYVAGTAYSAGQCFTYVLPSGASVTVNVEWIGVGSVAGTKSLHTPACDTDDIAIWGTSGNPQVWAACNVGATNAMPYENILNDWMSLDVGASLPKYSGAFFQWGNKADISNSPPTTGNGVSYRKTDCSVAPSVYSSLTNFVMTDAGGNTPFDWCEVSNNNLWGNTTNNNDARIGPCTSGYRVPNGGMNATASNYTVENNEWNTAYSIISTAGAGTFCDPTVFVTQFARTRCVLRLPRSGYRNWSNSSVYDTGQFGYYWTSSPDYQGARSVVFGSRQSNSVIVGGHIRSNGHTVRCIKN